MSDPLLVTTRTELQTFLQNHRRGPHADPGSRSSPRWVRLHDGHRALVREARRVADVVVVSIFVNPLQFGSADDLDRYPRTLTADLVVAAEEGVDVVWAPSVEEMYPSGSPLVTVSSGALGAMLEGASRPGHFDGVLTVVAKLFQPGAAARGRLRRQGRPAGRSGPAHGRDLDVGVHLTVVDTVRADDGLALSSRNDRLTEAGRMLASAIPRALAAARAAAPSGAGAARWPPRGPCSTRSQVSCSTTSHSSTPTPSSRSTPTWGGPTLVLVAATIEGTRLIDNALIPDRPVVDR